MFKKNLSYIIIHGLWLGCLLQCSLAYAQPAPFVDEPLTIPAATANEAAGTTIAWDGDVLAIGAPNHNSNGKTANGRILIYTYQGKHSPSWVLEKTIEGTRDNEELGKVIALSQNTLAATAHLTNTDDEVLIFDRHHMGTNAWGLRTTINEPEVNNARFGRSLSIDGDRIAIGYNQNSSNNSASSVAVAERNNGGLNTWGVTVQLLLPGNTQFGQSVSVRNNRLLVGAPRVNNGVNNNGAAYLFEYDGAVWNNTKIIQAPTPQMEGFFGTYVLLKEQVALVGQPGNTTQGTNAGAVHLFEQNEGGANNWGIRKTLVPPHQSPEARFGTHLDMQGERLIVGAANQAVYGKTNAGAIYMYERNLGGADQWSLYQSFLNSQGAANESLGQALALTPEFIITGQPGAQNGQGQVALKRWDTTTQRRTQSPALDLGFGRSMDADDKTLVIGAPLNGDQGERAGVVWLYDLGAMPQGQWRIADLPAPTKLYAPDAAQGDYFGASVAILGDLLVVGALQDKTYNQSLNRPVSGKAYIYLKTNNTWQHHQTLVLNQQEAQHFGQSLAVDERVIHVGAPEEGGEGAVYRYTFNANTMQWVLSQKLTPSTPQTTLFGEHIATQGGTLLVSGKNPTTGYVERFDTIDRQYNLTQSQQIITPTTDQPSFGAMSISGNILAVGAPNAQNLGEVHLFERPSPTQDFVKTTQLSTAQTSAQFGQHVTLKGNTLYVGAPGYHVQGAALVYRRTQAMQWSLQTKQHAWANAEGAGYDFGASFAVVGDHWFVGAPTAQMDNTVTNGRFNLISAINPINNNVTVDSPEQNAEFGQVMTTSGDLIAVGAPRENKVYLLERNQGGQNNWGILKTLDGPNDGRFGTSVALQDDTLVVGAPRAQDNDGEITIHYRNQGGANNWGIVQTRKGGNDDQLGTSVAISGDIIASGASREANNEGEVEIFERHDGGTDNWNRIRRIQAPTPQAGKRFGESIALEGNTLVVGEPNPGMGTQGSAHVFEAHTGGDNNWGHVKELTNNSSTANDLFGQRVYIQNNVIVVSAVNSDYINLYQRTATDWTEVQSIDNTIFQAASAFGNGSLCGQGIWMDDTTMVVGCPGHNRNGLANVNAGLIVTFERRAAGQWTRTNRVENTGGANERMGNAIARASSQVMFSRPGFSGDGRVTFVSNTRNAAAPTITTTTPTQGGQVSNNFSAQGTTDTNSWVVMTIEDQSGRVWIQRQQWSGDGNWSFEDLNLLPGNYTATLRAQRQGKWSTPQATSFTVDAALFLLVYQLDNQLINSLPQLNGATLPNTSVSVRVNNASYDQSTMVVSDAQGNWSLTWPDNMLMDGTYTVEITVDDGQGNVVTRTLTLTVDRTPPVPVITAPMDNSSIAEKTPTIQCQSEANSQVVLTLKDTSGTEVWQATLQADAQGDCSTTVMPQLQEQTYTLEAQATDQADNTGTSPTLTFTVDTTDPVVAIVGPTGPTNDANPIIRGTSDPAQQVVVVVRDGNMMVVNTQTVTTDAQGNWQSMPIMGLMDGTYTVEITATDLAGNQSSAQDSFTRDTTPPSLSLLSPSGIIGSGDPSIRGSSDANQDVAVTVFDAMGTQVFTQTVTSDAMGLWQTNTIMPALADGVYQIQVTASDALGNSAQDMGSFTVDTSFPKLVISTPAPNSAQNSRTINSSGQSDPGQVVNLTITDAQGMTVQSTMVTTDAQGNWRWDTMVNADGDFTLTGTATNMLGRQTSQSVDVTVDTQPPGLTISAPVDQQVYQTPPDVILTATDASEVTVTITDANGQVISQEAATRMPGGTNDGWSYSPGALADGTYTISIKATDGVGNTTNQDVSITIDTTAPQLTITSPNDGDKLMELRPKFTGTSDANEVSVTLTTPGAVQPVEDATVTVNGMDWSWQPSADLPLGEYRFEVSARDVAGNTITEAITIFIFKQLMLTLSAPVNGYLGPDNTPKWEGTINQPASLTLYVDGIELAKLDVDEANLPNFSWQNYATPLPDGARILRVDALADDGQTASANVDITIDTTAPEVTITWPTDGDKVNSDEMTIEGQTDSDLTNISLILDGGQPLVVPVQSDGRFEYTWSNVSEGNHTIEATAIDLANNMGSSGLVSIEVSYPEVIVSGEDEEGVIRNNQPTFQGKAAPGSEITIIIRDESGTIVQQGETVADDDGNWQYKLPEPLPDGRYTVDIEILEPGSTRKKKRRLVLIVDNFIPTPFETSYCFSVPHQTPNAPSALWILGLLGFAGVLRRRKTTR